MLRLKFDPTFRDEEKAPDMNTARLYICTNKNKVCRRNEGGGESHKRAGTIQTHLILPLGESTRERRNYGDAHASRSSYFSGGLGLEVVPEVDPVASKPENSAFIIASSLTNSVWMRSFSGWTLSPFFKTAVAAFIA